MLVRSAMEPSVQVQDLVLPSRHTWEVACFRDLFPLFISRASDITERVKRRVKQFLRTLTMMMMMVLSRLVKD